MKKLFYLFITAFIAFTIPVKSHAQQNPSLTFLSTASATKTSMSSADTASCVITASDYFRSMLVVGTKTSGTVAGKFYFYGSNDGTNYDVLDSLAVTNVTTAQQKSFLPSLPLRYVYYKVYVLSTNGVWTISGKQVTRYR